MIVCFFDFCNLAFSSVLSPPSYHLTKQLLRLNDFLFLLFDHSVLFCFSAGFFCYSGALTTFSVTMLRLLQHTTIQSVTT